MTASPRRRVAEPSAPAAYKSFYIAKHCHVQKDDTVGRWSWSKNGLGEDYQPPADAQSHGHDILRPDSMMTCPHNKQEDRFSLFLFKSSGAYHSCSPLLAMHLAPPTWKGLMQACAWNTSQISGRSGWFMASSGLARTFLHVMCCDCS